MKKLSRKSHEKPQERNADWLLGDGFISVGELGKDTTLDEALGRDINGEAAVGKIQLNLPKTCTEVCNYFSAGHNFKMLLNCCGAGSEGARPCSDSTGDKLLSMSPEELQAELAARTRHKAEQSLLANRFSDSLQLGVGAYRERYYTSLFNASPGRISWEAKYYRFVILQHLEYASCLCAA